MALWADLIHNCNIDFLKKASFAAKTTYAHVFIEFITIIQIDNTSGFSKAIRKYQVLCDQFMHILSNKMCMPVENSG
ncbi:MAG TPA: hypothetical protein DF774_14500 [Rheinheimera sp.]|nr:hypothetical protein [Rheinheimera sp.]